MAAGYRRSRKHRGFTLIELAIVVVILTVLASLALPQYVLYIRRTQTSEALTNLRKLYDSSVAYFQSDHALRDGAGMARRFPESVARTPDGEFCAAEAEGGKWRPNAGYWRSESWAALNFALMDPHYYAYEYDSSGVDSAAMFTARAMGDLNCDGRLSTFERVATTDSDLNVVGSGPVWWKDPLD